MSLAYNRRKKARRRALSQEQRDILNKIRRGIFPRFHLAKDPEDINQLERKLVTTARGRKKRKLTWRQTSTFKGLTETKSNETES